MKKIIPLLMIAAFLLTACAQPTPIPIPTRQPPTLTPTAAFTATPTLPPTFTPTATQNPDPSTWTKEEALANHEKERLIYLEEQGPAQSIPALEYHSDLYWMYGGALEMSPKAFESQMAWFHENHVHSVTGDELRDWLNGTLDLPARSVILTFDMGAHSSQYVPRMLDVFRKYQMFGLITIYHPSNHSESMDAGSTNCPDDRCWEAYRAAYESGYATIGTHTITHSKFSDMNEKDGLEEIQKSKQIIEEKIGNGCQVFILIWPLEDIPSWAVNLKSIGIDLAFGGGTYPILENTVWKNKPDDWFRLPRIWPPNSNGINGRGGKSLEEIMKMYTTSWE